MSASSRISIVIPVYQSEKSLVPLVERIQTALASLSSLISAYEVIFVNDGSRDESWNVVQQLVASRPHLRAINLMRNYGQHNALLCGIREARYPLIVTMDDDLQHPPEEISKLLAALTPDQDVVYGTPAKEQHGWWRDTASVVTKMALQTAMGTTIARQVSAFRLFRTQLRDAFSSYSSPYVSIDVLLTWATTKFGSVPVQHEPRTLGASTYTFRKLVRHAMNMITGFSVVPLRVATYSGFAFSFFGVLVLFWVVGRYLISGTSVQGFPFLASIIAIFSGVQLFSLGIMGEYLARMHFRLMEKPAYTVRELVSSDKQHE